MGRKHDIQEIDRMRQSTKEMLDGVGTDTEMERRFIQLIYGFTRSGFLECQAEKRFST